MSVTAFWRGYQSLVESLAPSLGNDYVKLFYDGGPRPDGSLSLYFRPWLAGEPYFGYQTNMGRSVLYVTKQPQSTDLRRYLSENPEALGEEKYYMHETGRGTLELFIELPPINIRTKTFEDWRDTAKYSYEKVVALYRLANKVFPRLPRR